MQTDSAGPELKAPGWAVEVGLVQRIYEINEDEAVA
jgi:hypothetical protein